jgi:putative transposase
MIADSLWEAIKNILCTKTSKVGRPPMNIKRALEGIIYVLQTGCQWYLLPREYGCHTTIHGIFMKWCRTGIIEKVFEIAREYYSKQNSENNWYAADSSSKKAPFANFGGKNPTDRSKQGIKHMLIVDRKGAPLFAHIAAANVHDSKLLKPVMSQMKKKEKLCILATDSAFDVRNLYSHCKENNIALIASPNPRRKKNVHKFNVPYRWKVEQTFGILSWLRGLKNCWSKTFEACLGFLQIACSLRLFKMAGI